ncbi:hypothetical protein [Paraburkholderia terricola]|uniref:Extensin n=1 Tax=Paraburkholderia terricola TaxID=169427 RepID=A0ABU1M1H3_9BURK|nr:hypothetical protein [Paraburkholderia terricola]MDR6412580.1 hypothetical protein [Paraburkholderia terricola]MDR6485057.1 hypothetical protein [Paraburkholderia terricola]
MRNTGKVLVVALVLAEVAFGAYFLTHNEDQSAPPADVTATATTATAGSRLDGTHITAGSVAGTAQPAPGVDTAARTAQPAPATNNAARTVQPAPSKDVLARAPTQSQVGSIAPETDLSAKRPVQAPQPKTQPRQELARAPAPAPVEASASVAAKPGTVPPSARARDNLSRQNPGSNAVASSFTDQLVKESAKLDPSLPPPSPSAPPLVRDDRSRRGPNPVAAALTDQLVRESSKLDPALPPPNQPGTK